MPPRHWRREATLFLRSRGFHYLLIDRNPDGPFVPLLLDLYQRQAEWGVVEAISSPSATLWELKAGPAAGQAEAAVR